MSEANGHKIKDKVVSQIKPETVIDRTGHDWEHWNSVLDEFDTAKKGYTASARHLRESHGVGMWWSNSIVTRYEYIRGLR